VDQLDRFRKLFRGNLWKLVGDFLRGREIDCAGGELLPIVDPDAAKATAAVEDQERLWRRM
jgi:hypothetical protein